MKGKGSKRYLLFSCLLSSKTRHALRTSSLIIVSVSFSPSLKSIGSFTLRDSLLVFYPRNKSTVILKSCNTCVSNTDICRWRQVWNRAKQSIGRCTERMSWNWFTLMSGLQSGLTRISQRDYRYELIGVKDSSSHKFFASLKRLKTLCSRFEDRRNSYWSWNNEKLYSCLEIISKMCSENVCWEKEIKKAPVFRSSLIHRWSGINCYECNKRGDTIYFQTQLSSFFYC